MEIIQEVKPEEIIQRVLQRLNERSGRAVLDSREVAESVVDIMRIVTNVINAKNKEIEQLKMQLKVQEKTIDALTRDNDRLRGVTPADKAKSKNKNK